MVCTIFFSSDALVMGQGPNGLNLTNYKTKSSKREPYFTNDGRSPKRENRRRKKTKPVKSHRDTKKCDTETKPAVHY